MPEGKSFWSSLPGILTALAGLLTAVGALVLDGPTFTPGCARSAEKVGSDVFVVSPGAALGPITPRFNRGRRAGGWLRSGACHAMLRGRGCGEVAM